MKDFQIISEADDSYHIKHKNGKAFTLDKKGLSKKSHEVIKKMCSGGMADGGTVDNTTIPEALQPSSDQSQQSPAQSTSGGSDTWEPETPSQAPANPIIQSKQGLENVLEQEQQAANKYGQQLGESAQAQQQAVKDYENQIAQDRALQQQQQQDFAKKDADLFMAVKNGKVDPNRLVNNMSTGSKILAGLGLLISGGGAGRSGTNLAFEEMNRAINNDISSQQNDLTNKTNLWKMNRESYQDDQKAHLVTQNQLWTIAQAKMHELAQGNLNADAQFKLSQLNSEIEQKKLANRQFLGLLGQSGQPSQPGQKPGMAFDPTVLLQQSGAPPEQIDKALAEVGVAQNVARNEDKILAAFDAAAKEQTMAKTGFGMLREGPHVAQLNQLMLPLFNDVDHSVRAAQIEESKHNISPKAGDFPNTTKTRREALKDWMESKKAAPTFRYITGLPLDSFQSTTPSPEMQTMNGHQYEKVAGGWRLVK